MYINIEKTNTEWLKLQELWIFDDTRAIKSA